MSNMNHNQESSRGRHDDDTALPEFLASLMDHTPTDKRLILTMDDLSKALCEYGVNVKHQEYFADSPSAGMDPAPRDE